MSIVALSSSIIHLWPRTRRIQNKHIPNSLTTLAGWWGIIPKYDIISLLSLASRLALASYFSSLSSPFQPLVICLSTRHNFSCSQVRLDINEREEIKLLNNVYLELRTGTLVNTGSLAPADFSGAVFTHAHFQKMAQKSNLSGWSLYILLFSKNAP